VQGSFALAGFLVGRFLTPARPPPSFGGGGILGLELRGTP
jgi:hypothetical protein